MPNSPILKPDGTVDRDAVRTRAIEQSKDLETVKDRKGRTWVRDFPTFVRMPEGVSAASPDGAIETRYIMRYANGRAEYVLDADDNGVAVGRLIHGSMDAPIDEIDDDGFVVTEEDRNEARTRQKDQEAAAAKLKRGDGLAVSE